jgi:hypothetical protein
LKRRIAKTLSDIAKLKELDMDEFTILEDILEASLKKNGDIPITIKHLLNIIKKIKNVNEEYSKIDYGVYDD